MADTPITTATTNFDQTVTALVLRTVEENLRDQLQWFQEGAYIPGTIVPGTNLIRHIAYGDLSVVAGTPSPATPPWLTEGTPPDEEPLTIGYAEYGASQAGRLIGITDVALAESPHNLMTIAAERVARNALATIDLNIAETVTAGTNVVYASTATARNQLTAAMKLTGDEVRQVVAQMKKSNIPTFPDGTYRAIIHPFQTYDLQADTAGAGWVEVSKYADPGRLLTGEIGKYMGVRFVESNIGTSVIDGGATSSDVYLATFFGPEYFAFGDLQTLSAYMVRPGGDHTDPLAQKALVGWKAMWGTKLLSITNVFPKYLRLETGGTLQLN